MAGEYEYNAEISVDVKDFIRRMGEADKMIQRLDDAGEKLDTTMGQELRSSLTKASRVAGRLEKQLKGDAVSARAATQAMAAYSRELEQTNRKAADFLAGSSPTVRRGLRTSSEKDIDTAHAAALRDEAQAQKASTAAQRADAAADKASLALTRKQIALNKAHSAALRENAVRDQEAAFASYSGNLRATKALEAKSAATARAAAMQEEYINTLTNTRYTLYDVSNSLMVLSGVTLAVAGVGTYFAASYESAFADVARTTGVTGDAVNQLRSDLINLTQQMPTSFADVASIAKLGGQLGIASQNIDVFTETVTKFSATTDVAVEQAAESFGRLAQLTKIPQDEIDNLGSAIYKTGVNAVATEDQIIAIAERIAASGNLAGLAADQIIGLSSALASLGVRPDAARGSIARIMNNITAAAEGGGQELQKFADVAGMSASAFAAAWENTPQAALTALVEGFNRVIEKGGNLDAVFESLGVNAVRDKRALKLLSSNTEVYAQALQDAATGYKENTALSEGYAYVNQTLTSKLIKLWNTLKAIMAQGLGPFAEGLKVVVDALTSFLGVVEDFTSTKFGAVLFSTTAAVSVAAAALLGLGGILGRVVGGVMGAVVAMRDISAALSGGTSAAGRFGVALRTTTRSFGAAISQGRLWQGTLGRLTASTNAATAANERFAASNRTVAASGRHRAAGAAVSGIGGGGRHSAGVGSVVGSTLKNLAKGGLVIGAFMAATHLAVKGISALAEAFESADSRAEELFGSASGLSSAIQKDTQAFRAATAAGKDTSSTFRTITVETSKSTSQLSGWAQNLEGALGAQVQLGEGTSSTTEKIKNQTVALGQNTKAFIANKLANNKEFQKFFRENERLMQQAGISLETALQRSLKSQGGGARYIDSIISKLRELKNVQSQIAADPGASASERQAAFERVNSLNSQLDAARQVKQEFSAIDQTISGTVGSIRAATAVNNAFGVSAQGTAVAMGQEAKSAKDMVNALFGGVSAAAELRGSLYDLQKSLITNGATFNIMSEAGRANMTALRNTVDIMAQQAEAGIGDFSNSLLFLMTRLNTAGATGGHALDFLRQKMVQAFNRKWGLDLDISAAMGDIETFIKAAITALQTRARLERAAIREAQSAAENPTSLAAGLTSIGKASAGALQVHGYEEQISALKNLSDQISSVQQNTVETGQAIRRDIGGSAGGIGNAADAAGGLADSMDDVGSSAQKAADDVEKLQEEVYTLVDYASDLDSIWNRAFDISFGSQIAGDSTASMLKDMRDGFNEAAQAIRETKEEIDKMKASLQSLAADRKILEFQLKVATDYGDTKRATEIRAELAENSAEASDKASDLTEKQDELDKAFAESSRELQGNSAAARRNRSAVLDLVRSYQAEIIALAESGASKDKLQRKTRELRADFVRNLTQMGYNRREVNRYAGAFNHLTTIIRRVPRNITVDANTNPATQAMNEWLARNDNHKVRVKADLYGLPNRVTGGTYSPSNVDVGGGGMYTPSLYASDTDTHDLDVRSVVRAGVASVGNMLIRSIAGAGVRAAFAGFSSGGSVPEYHATGGVHGMHPGAPQGTDTTPAWLTPGEFVQRKAAVQHYGVPFMNAINNMQIPKKFATGGPVGAQTTGTQSGIMTVELMPHQLRQLKNALSVEIGIGNQQVANAANRANMDLSSRGAN